MTDREISLPFRVDPQGRVAAVTDPSDRARQHITTYMVTATGERVMRPEFGTALRDTVFEPLTTLTSSLLLTRVREAVNQDVADVVLQSLSSPLDSDTGTLQVTVEFALAVGAGTGATDSTTITMGGSE